MEKNKSKRICKGQLSGNAEWQALGKRKAAKVQDESGSWERDNIPQPLLAGQMSAEQANSFQVKMKRISREQKIKIVRDILKKSIGPMFATEIARSSRVIGVRAWVHEVCRQMLKDGILKKKGLKYELS